MRRRGPGREAEAPLGLSEPIDIRGGGAHEAVEATAVEHDINEVVSGHSISRSPNAATQSVVTSGWPVLDQGLSGGLKKSSVRHQEKLSTTSGSSGEDEPGY